MQSKNTKPVYAIVSCQFYKEKFHIPLKSLKNNENICAHCPIRKECKHRDNARLHPFASDIVHKKLPVVIVK